MDIDTPPPSPTSPPSVLLVEPDSALAARYTEWLEDGYDVRTVESRNETIDAIDGEIDVIVFDRRGSNSDSSPGAETLLQTIRDRDFDCRIAMIVTADPSFDGAPRRLDDALVAPISATDLRGVVDRLALQATYDDQLRTFYELASKRALLDRDRPDAELAASRRYAALEDRLAVARARADETVADVLAFANDRHRRDAVRNVLRDEEH
ncbi:HalX domain-containing protein [Halopiger xanaduensis]|uniref:HalX domain protein n=1 Tax=Halopiger xanaduensis (strain DSM 18323 / JCM 14033 / SH-6) TaxID=797210 RepID=F8D7F4_HALXS|nr:HalX domain-containing protein [Halopiger xanaduensis]AEH37874.1 HalX domain protein [Halopiger xanaduensis SH-6]